ncbi:ice-binding family protein [Rhodoferax sp.]|uniref:ice-binding family protein n=1 Tax=Rhodoferax sp. TaxID=50421 RepID=UPI002760DDE2|nr:ice-binding family protein [Rhodoferax sp.]
MNKFDSFSRVVPWFMALLLGTVVAGCGGGGQDPILGGDVATLAPTVTAVSPLAGATMVPVGTRAITASFSKTMDASTLTAANFTLACPGTTAITGGTVSYTAVGNMATLSLPALGVLPASSLCTAKISTAARDNSGAALQSDFSWSFTTGPNPDTTPPTVTLVNPADLATNVATTSAVNATFSEAMDPLTLSTATFSVAGVTGLVGYNATSQIATFTPGSNLAANTTYTATVSTGAKDLAGNALAANKVWSFTTAAVPVIPPPSVNLGSASSYGTFGGTAGMTNMGTLTLINGNIGTTATGTSSITGFHDTAGDIYTETTLNRGAVNGLIHTCTNSTTGPTSAGVNAAACALATQARLDAQSAYLALAAMPPGANPGANLAGLTLAPGVYTSPSGSFLIEGADLTLDAQGDANAVFVFQMATTLTVGGPGAAAPRSILLAGGAQARNVFWQVGSFATINAAGGGTMVGNILAQAGVSFSTAGNVNVVTLNGRALSLGASVTLVNTVINMP